MAYREYRESVLDVISASFDPELLLVMKLLKIQRGISCSLSHIVVKSIQCALEFQLAILIFDVSARFINNIGCSANEMVKDPQQCFLWFKMTSSNILFSSIEEQRNQKGEKKITFKKKLIIQLYAAALLRIREVTLFWQFEHKKLTGNDTVQVLKLQQTASLEHFCNAKECFTTFITH